MLFRGGLFSWQCYNKKNKLKIWLFSEYSSNHGRKVLYRKRLIIRIKRLLIPPFTKIDSILNKHFKIIKNNYG